jgi:hypothetical protein
VVALALDGEIIHGIIQHDACAGHHDACGEQLANGGGEGAYAAGGVGGGDVRGACVCGGCCLCSGWVSDCASEKGNRG